MNGAAPTKGVAGAVSTCAAAGCTGRKQRRFRTRQGVKIAIVTWREELAGATARTFAGPTGFRRNGATVTMKAVLFFHDVSQYRGGPLTPSKVSMVIICP
ncbi:hypothetical protein pRL110342 (plasmid) [Rhizobium johnstonii 3841]|uniref:Uncharacterized protein n=1 Tax=Rhizobium johnstonii (strain DSM 114642 / LMG 32736 / 3841) TaxID=216596 RepID=Q1M647_RHIJ3|nr:hypothetical protein pRL110342 [Rhizobium johnstonii 3841]